MKKLTGIIWIFSLLLSCSKSDDDGPGGLSAPQLSYPANNSECTSGVVNVNDPGVSTIIFKWEHTANAKNYQLKVNNLLSERTNIYNTTANDYEVSLNRGTPYSWSVTAQSGTQTITDKESEVWKFYNAGEGIENYAPFPAELLYPQSGALVYISDGSLELSWKGSDIDDDISGYDVLIDGNTVPTTRVGSSTVGIEKLKVQDLIKGNTYYWQVITTDEAGNKSYSEISQFVVGE